MDIARVKGIERGVPGAHPPGVHPCTGHEDDRRLAGHHAPGHARARQVLRDRRERPEPYIDIPEIIRIFVAEGYKRLHLLRMWKATRTGTSENSTRSPSSARSATSIRRSAAAALRPAPAEESK
ncbi:hypothetical protein ACRAWF_36680 [Streptomyces sp. L7]